ncbi:MAG: phosphoenolpyruvate--protein phosphotransferase, partial [Bacilli bacterium]
MTFIKNGTAASPGYAIAHAFLLEAIDLSFERLEGMNSTDEISRLDQSLQKALEEIKSLQDHAIEQLGEDKAEIFGAHLLLLQDPEYINAVKDLIKQKKINAEAAFADVSQSFIVMFDTMDNEYMKDRAADIRDVSNRVLSHLLGKGSHSLGLIEEPVIIIAHDLTPSDTAQLDPHFVKGFATNIGGRTSHSAIMARSLEIPAVVGLKDITESVKHGDKIIINGNEGMVIISPSSIDVSTYEQKIEEYELDKNELRGLIDSASITLDGHTVELVANIGIPEDAMNALQYGTEGVGLFRTEFLYMGRDDFPTEEEQYSSYKKVAETMGDRPVIIRTLDIGGDKELSYLKLPKEMNPFLGIRAIRLCLDRKDLFKTQLRAILRASKHG